MSGLAGEHFCAVCVSVSLCRMLVECLLTNVRLIVLEWLYESSVMIFCDVLFCVVVFVLIDIDVAHV